VPNEQEIPDVVYHYTSMDTLLKIVESGFIWATNIRYLNDVMERRHCLDQIRSFMSLHEPNEVIDKAKLLGLLDEKQENEKSFYFLPFVASFSKERDSLPQWRSYCPRGNGVSIGFRTESLVNGFVEKFDPFISTGEGKKLKLYRYIPPSVSFGPVRYLKADDLIDMAELIAQAVQEAEEMKVDEDGWPQGWDDTDFFYQAIDKYASRTKHFSFESEREYRLLATTTWGNDKSIKYRSSSSTLIPYIPVSLPNPKKFLHFSDQETIHPIHVELPSSPLMPYFITSVTIGPTPNLELSADALNGFFAARKYGVRIFKSSVPFRDL